MPQDGQAKQDCDRAAGKRWLRKHAAQVAPHGVTLLGDDRYSNQSLGALALQEGYVSSLLASLIPMPNSMSASRFGRLPMR